DEDVDRSLYDAMRAGAIETMASLGEPIFQGGTSEVKNWMPVAAAMSTLGYGFSAVDYIPCYRSAAGTGNAMGFAYWQAGRAPRDADGLPVTWSRISATRSGQSKSLSSVRTDVLQRHQCHHVFAQIRSRGRLVAQCGQCAREGNRAAMFHFCIGIE